MVGYRYCRATMLFIICQNFAELRLRMTTLILWCDFHSRSRQAAISRSSWDMNPFQKRCKFQQRLACCALGGATFCGIVCGSGGGLMLGYMFGIRCCCVLGCREADEVWWLFDSEGLVTRFFQYNFTCNIRSLQIWLKHPAFCVNLVVQH